ncbi:MAG: YigZ family protein [Lachnospiraceae bacterium]|nr:YigZ family protein [Lachnospiraceae bacterium]
MPDTDRSIYKGGIGEVVEKKSRFIATIEPVTSKEEAESMIAACKKKYWDARHNCSAYIIADTVDILHSSDDGEPSGTAGKPMLDILVAQGLKNVCVVVTRYFGGTLLGTGGLVRAYQAAVKAGLEQCTFIEKKKGIKATVALDYNDVGKIQYLFATEKVETISTDYGEKVSMSLIIPHDAFSNVKEKLVDITSGKSSFQDVSEAYYALVEGEIKLWTKD